MPSNLEKTHELVDSYAVQAEDVDPTMQEHACAMIVRDIEDVVGLGVYVMRIWLRCSDEWHKWVSGSIDRYDAAQHELVKTIEQQIIATGHEVVGFIKVATGWGYSIDNEDVFNGLLDEIVSQASPISEEFQATTLRKHYDQAKLDYQSGLTEAVENPWS